MFLNDFFNILFWSLAIFGFFCIIKMLASYIILKNSSYITSEIVLKVKNDEDTIENTIRTLAEEIFFTSRENLICELVVVDMGCIDETIDIVRAMQNQYRFIRLTTKEEYFNIYD